MESTPLLPLYGIIGYPLSHSFSPAYFRKKFAEKGLYASYETFPLTSIAQYPELLASHPNLAGLNVTLPYKESVIPYLNQIDSIAAEIGAVNCIAFIGKKTRGFNTDHEGFWQSLNPLLKAQHTHALILGSGGGARAVAYVLTQLGIQYQKVSASQQPGCISYQQVTPAVAEQHKLIINTTPLGMYPHTGGEPLLPYQAIGRQHLLYDLIYNPNETRFLIRGKANGAVTKNGYEMLKIQADVSWDIWNRNWL